MRKRSKTKELHCIRVLVPKELLAIIYENAREESRKISPMIRRILELHYENKL